MTASRPILIMQTGNVPGAIVGDTGDFGAMFHRMANYGSTPSVVVDVANGQTPDCFSAYSGTIVTGSPAMVTDREEWSEKSGEWLREAIVNGHKVLGVCYGHQLMAQALGGAADYHPGGMEIGTHAIHLSSKAQEHHLLKDLPPIFDANLVHSQTVSAVPQNGVSLALSEHDSHQIIAYGPNALSVQFHPEFDRAVMQRYIDWIEPKAKKPLVLGSPAKETPTAAALLQRFVDFCRR